MVSILQLTTYLKIALLFNAMLILIEPFLLQLVDMLSGVVLVWIACHFKQYMVGIYVSSQIKINE